MWELERYIFKIVLNKILCIPNFLIQSSLVHAILKELPLTKGSISVNGVISYACQDPWLFAGSVRQNIIFGLPMDKERYKKVNTFFSNI